MTEISPIYTPAEGLYQQHVIDLWRHKGYRVTVLSDGALMCFSEAAWLQGDPQNLADAVERLHAARWSRRDHFHQ